MRITNFSEIIIVCKVNDKCICIEPGSSFECGEKFNFIIFAASKKSYSKLEAERSKILKALSFFDDPFKLIKEYHLVINSLFSNESICNSQQLNITVETCYADTDTRTYYDFVNLEADGRLIKPTEVSVSTQEKIREDFMLNNTKLAKWQVVWDVIIEPIIFEVIGYYAVCRIFSVWFGVDAWKIVLLLLVPNVMFEVLMLFFKRRKYKKRADKFHKHFSSQVICDCCYGNLY